MRYILKKDDLVKYIGDGSQYGDLCIVKEYYPHNEDKNTRLVLEVSCQSSLFGGLWWSKDIICSEEDVSPVKDNLELDLRTDVYCLPWDSKKINLTTIMGDRIIFPSLRLKTIVRTTKGKSGKIIGILSTPEGFIYQVQLDGGFRTPELFRLHQLTPVYYKNKDFRPSYLDQHRKLA